MSAHDSKKEAELQNIQKWCGIYIVLYISAVRKLQFAAALGLLSVFGWNKDPNIVIRLKVDAIMKGITTIIPSLQPYGWKF